LVDRDATSPGVPFSEPTGPAVRLTVQRGSHEGAVIECRRVVTLIGSRPGCKIQLNHPLVSPVHVAIVNDNGEAYAVDLVSNRGTLLNDLKMEHERLSNGDLITIEPWVFRVGIGRGARRTNGNTPSVPLEFAPHLIAFEHLESGRILKPDRKICTIGRRSGCDIQVDDPDVSRAHALFFIHDDHPTVVDLCTRNGTYVNDEPIGFRVLKDKDVVRIGDARFRVCVIVPSAGVPKAKPVDDVTPPGSVRPAGGSNGTASPIKLDDDLVDIQAVEGSQRWHIAESVKQPAPKRRIAR